MSSKHLLAVFIAFLPFQAIQSQDLTDEELKFWWQKDLEQDSIPGVGLERVYKELIKDKKGEEVIVAVLDIKIDMLHEDFKGIFWVNKDEIPFNGTDDDANGYIDDTNGWNFIGNEKGEDLSGQFLEPARIVNSLKKKYESINQSEIPEKDKEEYQIFAVAKKQADKELNELKDLIKRADSIFAIYYRAKDSVNYLLQGRKYNFKTVDSLKIKFPNLEPDLNTLSLILQNGYTDQKVKEEQDYFIGLLRFSDYNSRDARILVGDDPEDLSDNHYGNPILINNELDFQHSTGVTGLIAANRTNELGIKGFGSSIKIMPVVMVADGYQNDKDVALGIRYAVDNGADIINMSWGKYFSTHRPWVEDAISYAEKKGVLVVTSSGNDSKDIDMEKNYPSDLKKKKEYVSNFIKVGGTTHKVDSTFTTSFSNYGRQNVDLFAPAEKIFTTEVKSSYYSGGGTSYASPMVAGTAALLKSYFPELSAVQLKEIILSSGTKLDIMVKRPGDDKNAPLVPFSSLSKTGSILNTYAAFKKAMELTSQD